MTYAYQAYSLVIHTPFPCPQLKAVELLTAPDIVVKEAPVAKRLDNCVVSDQRWDAAPGRYLWRGGPQSGRFLVEEGKKILLDRNPEASDDLLATHFLSNVIVALLRQRGFLVLHASTAAYHTDKGVMAISVSGESGVGKSTSLAAILSAGGSMLSDDITAINLSLDGHPVVIPGVPRIYLCTDSALELSYDPDTLDTRSGGRAKSVIPSLPNMAVNSAPLAKLFVLHKYSGDRLRLRRLKGHERFVAIQNSIYGPMFPEEHPSHFSLFSALVDQVEVYWLERPVDIWTSKEILKVLLNA